MKIIREVKSGVFLDGKELGEILLQRRHMPRQYKTDDVVDVFLFAESKDRIIATTKQPFASVGQCAMLKVISLTSAGAFLDWGLHKNLLVPHSEQQKKMREGRSYLVYVYIDEFNGRVLASSKLDNFLGLQPPEFKEGQAVDLIVASHTDLGIKTVVNNCHWGLLYKDELFEPLEIGQKVQGFIKKIRPDQKIDLILQPPGYQKIDGISSAILARLKQQGGFVAVTDKSDPDTIKRQFSISKKSYKKAIGALYKRRLISIEKDGIRLKN